MKPKEIIAEIMDRIPCVERPGHNMLAHEIVKKLEAGGYVIVPKEPTEEMKRAAFGPIMMGGRGGPITSDMIRQEAALSIYRKIIEAA